MVISNSTAHHTISVNTLPSGPSVIFKDSGYFVRNGLDCSLPSPAEVRANDGPGKKRSTDPVRFEALNLIVKYGREIKASEGQCMWAIRKLLPDQLPVPEVYGWVQDSDEVFIYMELIKGETLEDRWKSLLRDEREDVCQQFQSMLLELRKLQQDLEDQFLGHIDRQPLLDIDFTDSVKPAAGPFNSTQEFHDWLLLIGISQVGIQATGNTAKLCLQISWMKIGMIKYQGF